MVKTSDVGSMVEEDNNCVVELIKPAVETKVILVLSIGSVVDLV